MAGSPTRQRMIQLDVMRCIAILLVLGYHPVVKFESDANVPWLPYVWYRLGWTGVDLFFVLSGFLIGGLLFGEHRSRGKIDIRRFLVRRIFKIWPAYYFFLGVLLLIALRENLVGSFPPFLLHIQNYTNNDLAPHTWSLAVEEHFYVILPFVLTGLLAIRNSLVFVTVTATLLIVCALMRGLSAPHSMPIEPTHLRIDTLWLGVVLAYCYHYHRTGFMAVANMRLGLMLAGSAMVALVAIPQWRQYGMPDWAVSAFVPLGVAFGFAACLMAAMGQPRPGPLDRRPTRLVSAMAAIGVYSYGIYLWHFHAGYMLVSMAVENGFLGDLSLIWRWSIATLIYVLLAVGAGVLTSRCIEIPALAVRDRLAPGLSRPLG